MSEQAKTRFIVWDWKGAPDLKALRTLLEPFGLFVYEDPWFKNQDTFGYVVSSQALDEEGLRRKSQAQWDEDFEPDSDHTLIPTEH